MSFKVVQLPIFCPCFRKATMLVLPSIRNWRRTPCFDWERKVERRGEGRRTAKFILTRKETNDLKKKNHFDWERRVVRRRKVNYEILP